MKAAILKAFGTPLAVETLPAPRGGTGEVVVDVVAAGVLAYANEVFSGERKYQLLLPVVPVRLVRELPRLLRRQNRKRRNSSDSRSSLTQLRSRCFVPTTLC